MKPMPMLAAALSALVVAGAAGAAEPQPAPRQAGPAAAAQPGVAQPRGDMNASLEALRRGDGPAFLAEAIRDAEAGIPEAQLVVGLFHAEGHMGVPVNHAEAARWWRRAAEAGNAAAEFNLAALHVAGLGVERDEAEFVRLLSSAALHGHLQAKEVLGDLLANGRVLQRDPAMGVAFWIEAARGGLPTAQMKVASAYASGLGVERSAEESLYWLSLAGSGTGDLAARGRAAAAMEAVELDPEAIARVQARVAGMPVAAPAATVNSPAAAQEAASPATAQDATGR